MSAIFDSSYLSGDAIFDASYADAAPAVTLREDYERSSVNLSGSSVAGVGDDALISIKPRLQESEIISSTSRWMEPSVRVDGVADIRPTFRLLDYTTSPAPGGYHGAPWVSTRRPMYSYDRVTWHYFDTQTVAATYIEFRHSTAFTGDTIYVGRSRQLSVNQIGSWVAALATAHPTKIAPTASAAAFTPTLTSWPAQPYIAGEFAAQTDELGRTIPATPLYAFEINDSALGGSKQLVVMTAGIHAGEDHAEYVMQAMIDDLLGSSDEAVYLRTQYRFLIYPMLNAPGRAGGGWRGSYAQGTGGIDDGNRHFKDTSPGLEIVTVPRAVMLSDLGSDVPALMLDWHGTHANNWALFEDSGNTLQAEMRSRLASEAGVTVADEGATHTGFVSRWYQDTVGVPLAVTLEFGDQTPKSDADLSGFGSAVTRVIESMSVDGLLGVSGDVAAVGVALASGAAGLVANVTLSASSLAQAAGAAGLSADVLLSGAGAAQAAGNATLAAQLSALAAGAAEASGGAALSGGGSGELGAGGGAVASGVAGLVVTVSLSGVGAAVAAGSAALSGGALGELGALGGAVASGSATVAGASAGDLAAAGGVVADGAGGLRASVALSAAGFVQAMGAGVLVVQVPLAAVGGGVASGVAGLVDGSVFVLVRDSAFWVADGRRFRVRAAWPRVG